MANLGWFIAVGIISLLVAIINTIIAKPPIAAWLAITIADSSLDIDEKTQDDMQSYSLLVEVLVIIKAMHFVFWYYYSNSFLKQRKVSQMYKIMKLFLYLMALYISFSAFEIWITMEFIT